ncbi:spore germination protein GerPC [Lentibacillus sp. Marseille-P4043]|uniref:spore germination protein GerPC n=1 Tax=Lentibacillus sp. Marseille-P4043 TaxID=2040293 RepID=UPI000D0B833C|nr:spore germination protein GerPC [Lentibacillus sp. Marseille-P4043]
MNGNEWTTYFYDLHQHIQEQGKKIKELESKLDQVETISKEKNKNTIEKIEYNFDQLKIERLEGTLHIGLSPSDLANIDDLGINQTNPANFQPPMKQSLLSDLSQHINQEGPALIQDLANQYRKPVDEGFQSIMLQDIEKQLPQRIAFYEQEAKDQNINSEDQLTAYITEQIKNEIYQSLVNYMQNNEQKGADQ